MTGSDSNWTIEFSFENTLQTVRATVETELTLGRVTADQIVFRGLDLTPYGAATSGVSRRHALIRWQGSQLVICDLHSSNGTMLNGTRLQPDLEYRLKDGDLLHIGHLPVTVRINTEAGRSTIRARRDGFNLENGLVSGHGERILVVEDDALFGKLYQATLEQAGYSVRTCSEVINAIRAVGQCSPSLVLMDLKLSNSHGIDLCRYLRRDLDGPKLPIVVVSAENSELCVRQIMEAGADIYMTKPVNIRELIRVVSALIYQQEIENPARGTRQLPSTASLEQTQDVPRDNTVVIFVEGHREPITIAVNSQITFGRRLPGPSSRLQSHIDLDPYGAFDKGVSRLHARITWQDNVLLLEDMGSSNGTRVNGLRVRPNEPQPLKADQHILFGDLQMRISLLKKENLAHSA